MHGDDRPDDKSGGNADGGGHAGAAAPAAGVPQPVNLGDPFPTIVPFEAMKCVAATILSTRDRESGWSKALTAGTIPKRRRIHAACRASTE